MSLVRKDVGDFQIVAGNPLRLVKMRDKDRLLELERQFLGEEARTVPGANSVGGA
jgi:hypothetical protein